MKPYISLALISMLFAGLTSVLAKTGMVRLNADVALGVRSVFVTVFVVAQVLASNQLPNLRTATPRDYAFLAASAATTALSWLFYYRAIKVGEVGSVAAIDKGSILVTILLSTLFLGEPLTPKLMLAATLIFAGLVVLVVG